MEAFVSRKRRKITIEDENTREIPASSYTNQHDEESTDEKLALLSSVFEDKSGEELLLALLDCDGFVERAIDFLLNATAIAESPSAVRRKTSATHGLQSSLSFGNNGTGSKSVNSSPSKCNAVLKPLTRKGKTLYLYSPEDISKHTPCTVIHNFLPPDLANQLLRELLPETESYTSATFKLFDNVVQSPHTASFYVNDLTEAARQKSAYLYNGSTLSDVREILPVMRQVSQLIDKAVNEEIEKRIRAHYQGGLKLRYQHPPGLWRPNAAFVNCYDGAQQSVGWHTDQLTYLGPHPTIGSLSLGVQREFRIRRIVPTPDIERLSAAEAEKLKEEAAHAQGQISLPLPHNSLLVMHADMQEGWKHSVAPAGGKTGGLVPHPIAGRKRVNITYRWYREEFEPKYTPKCRCKIKIKSIGKDGKKVEREEGVPCVLKTVMKQKETFGKYLWMCQTPGRVDVDLVGQEEKQNAGLAAGKGCGFFEWAEFDDDGAPLPPRQKVS